MSNSQEVEIYKNICEKLIDENPNYDETTKKELKIIIKSNDNGKIVLKRLMEYLAVK